MYFGTGIICGALAVIILWVIIFIDKKLDNNKKELEKVKIELSSLGKMSDQNFYYIYFNKILGTKPKPTSASIEIIVGLYRNEHYQITLSGLGFGFLKSIEFDIKYYSKDDMRKIIERALNK